MPARLRTLARLLTAAALVAAYTALQLAVTAGLRLRARADFDGGPEQAAPGGDAGSWELASLYCAAAAAVLAVPALLLRQRRLRGAAETVELVNRYVAHRPPWHRPLLLLADNTGYLLFAAGTLGASMSQRQGYKYSPTTQIALLLGGLAVLGAGVGVLRYTRPRSARSAERALLRDGRRPVLYLRSFADDDSAAEVDDGAFVNLHSREEQLAGALACVGPVIAVGKPYEERPRLGADRFYLPLDDWKPTVLRLMDLSQLIVLRLGAGDGLWWEVEQACATQPPSRLALLVPAGHPDLAEQLDRRLPEPARLGEQPDHAAVVTFGPDWRPLVHRVGPAPPAPKQRKRFPPGWIRALGVVFRPSTYAPVTPAAHTVRAIQAALAAAGTRRRTMYWRATFALQNALWRGMAVCTAAGLLLWLAARTLELLPGPR